jgi:WD repeat-containing protein 17
MQMLGTALAKKEDRLQLAANLMLKAGNFKMYCKLMLKQDKWEDAIAYAPKVSLEYWQSLVT